MDDENKSGTILKNPENTAENATGTAVPNPAPTFVERIAVKMPQFSKDDIKFFFWQAEASFALSNVSVELTKYHHVVTAIPQDILRDVADVIRNPPIAPYTAIKERLLSIYADSEDQRIRRVLQQMALGDRKPSALLREMEHHAQDKLAPAVMCTLFTSLLPDDVQRILAPSTSPLTELAAMADKIMDVGPARSVAATATAQTVNPAAPASQQQVSELVGALNKLRREVANLRQNQRRGRSSSPHPNRVRGRSQSRKKFDTCWYHFEHGEDARNCRD